MQRSNSILWALLIILLVLNLALLYSLNSARMTTIETLYKVEIMLDELANEVITYDIEVSQAVPIKADVPLNQTVKIPLNTVIPFDQELTLPLPTSLGEVMVDLPIKTDVPLDMVVPVDFNETINVDTVIQLQATVPVEIDIDQTALAGYLRQASSDVAQLRNRFTLWRGSEAAAEHVVLTASTGETSANSTPVAGDSQSQVVSVETVATEVPTSESVLKSDTSDISLSASAKPASSSNNTITQPDLGWCAHTYWPLRPGTRWIYNSPDTSYSQGVIDVLNSQVYLSTQYEGRNIQFSLECYSDGLGGSFLGDMRRITKFGDLNFSNKYGMFLPRPEIMEKIGNPWTQEYDISGTVEGRQGDRPVVGHISRGRGIAVYTPTGFETLKTPLGPRQALRIEQKLDLELDIAFDLAGQTIPANEVVTLTNAYWFVKGIGPVKIHWQGGTIQKEFKLDDMPIHQQSAIPGLAEEQLLFVCVLPEEQSTECMQVPGISQSDLTVPPESEMEIQGFVFPDDTSDEQTTTVTEPGISEQPEGPISPAAESTRERAEHDSEQAALLEYAENVARLGEKITAAGEEFVASAIAYRNDDLTLDEFRNKFSSFESKVKGPIGDIDSLSPPSEAEAIHQELTDGLEKCDEAIDLMNEWFDTQDSGTKEATALLVYDCMNQVDRAAGELEALISRD